MIPLPKIQTNCTTEHVCGSVGILALGSGDGACFSPYHIVVYCLVIFIESRAFSMKLQACAGAYADDVLRLIQDDLQKNPERGAMVPGLGGVRKARVANPLRGKGKRGGFRYLYLYLVRRQHIHMLLLLDKDEQEDANEEQRRQIREWVKQIIEVSRG